MQKLIFKILIIIFLTNTPVYAYLGPGIGGGILAATLGVVIAIFAAILGLIWFPLKRFLKKRKGKKKERQKKFD